MSRVAKAPVNLPKGVELTIDKKSCVFTMKSSNGVLVQSYNNLVDVCRDKNDENVITFKPASNDPHGWAHAGTARALLNNMAVGLTSGFEKTLHLVGVGYRAQVQGNKIALSLGMSHSIDYVLPDLVKAECPNNTTIVLKSTSKPILGQAAAEIRAFRPPEPYKGKGIKYSDEQIVRKEAKKK